MDFIMFAALMGLTLLRIILTYDIICQWSKNFRKRMADFPPEMQIPETTKVDVAIPGWHINAHGESCRENFNLSYMEGAGRTVGEDIETTWVGTNALGPSVREMGPAARHVVLMAEPPEPLATRRHGESLGVGTWRLVARVARVKTSV